MTENTSNLACSHCCRGTNSRCSSVLAGKHQTILPHKKTKGRLKIRLGFETVLGKTSCAPWGDAPARDWEGAQPLVLQRGKSWLGKVLVTGSSMRWTWLGWPAARWGNSQRDGLMHSRGGFGLEKVLIPFSFRGVDVQPKTRHSPPKGARGSQEKD